MRIRFTFSGKQYEEFVPIGVRHDQTTGTPYQLMMRLGNQQYDASGSLSPALKMTVLTLRLRHYNVQDDVVDYDVIGISET